MAVFTFTSTNSICISSLNIKKSETICLGACTWNVSAQQENESCKTRHWTVIYKSSGVLRSASDAL